MNRTRAGPSVLRTAVIVTAPLTWTNRYESLSTRFVRIAVRIPRVCIDSCYNNKISNWHNIECLVLLLWKLASFFYCKQFSLGKETSNKYLKCPYHQNFYFPIWSYISHNELLRKKFSIWIKSDFFNECLKTWKSYFLEVDPCRWSQHWHSQSCDIDSGMCDFRIDLSHSFYLCKFSFLVHAKCSFPAFCMNY